MSPMERIGLLAAAMYLMYQLQGWKFGIAQCLLCKRRAGHSPDCPTRKLR